MKHPGARLQKRYDRALVSVQQIVASGRVKEFCVGITGNATARRAAYERWCRKSEANLDGFAIIDWNRSPDEAVDAERWLFDQVCRHPKYANVHNVRYFPSVNRKLESQVLYLAWWSPPFAGR